MAGWLDQFDPPGEAAARRAVPAWLRDVYGARPGQDSFDLGTEWMTVRMWDGGAGVLVTRGDVSGTIMRVGFGDERHAYDFVEAVLNGKPRPALRADPPSVLPHTRMFLFVAAPEVGGSLDASRPLRAALIRPPYDVHVHQSEFTIDVESVEVQHHHRQLPPGVPE